MILGLAPMDGYTDCAFRQIVKEIFDKYGEKNKYQLYLRTEFMNADGYIRNPLGVIKHLLTDTTQQHVVAQMFGSNEKSLVQCFKDIEKKYKKIFSFIELNMGCPAKNVMNTGGGSALMKNRKTSLSLIISLRNAVRMPFSIKVRTGLDEYDTKEQFMFLIEASNYVDMITVHGRTTKQIYSGEVNWNFIYELKKKANNQCKIIGNGGIKHYNEIALLQGNLDGIMIGQAAIGNPRIFTPHIPTKKELYETIVKHLHYMIAYEQFFQEQKTKNITTLHMPKIQNITTTPSKNIPQIVVVEFRKHLFQYLKGLPGSKEMKQKLSNITEYNVLIHTIHDFFS